MSTAGCGSTPGVESSRWAFAAAARSSTSVSATASAFHIGLRLGQRSSVAAQSSCGAKDIRVAGIDHHAFDRLSSSAAGWCTR